MNRTDEFTDFLRQTMQDVQNVYRTGMEQGRSQPDRGSVAEAFQNQEMMRAVVAAYDKALKDEEAKLPTYLHMALEMARRYC